MTAKFLINFGSTILVAFCFENSYQKTDILICDNFCNPSSLFILSFITMKLHLYHTYMKAYAYVNKRIQWWRHQGRK